MYKELIDKILYEKKLYGFELYNDKRKVSSYYLKEKYLIDDKNSNLSIFNNCKQKKILEDLTSFSLSRNF